MLTNATQLLTAELIGEVETLLERFIVLPSDNAKIALALFVLHTWAFEAAHATPYIIVLSAEKQSGKSRLMELLEFVTRNPLKTASATEAALYQYIDKVKPTLYFDETDAMFTTKSDRSEGIRGIIDSGNRPGTYIIRGGKDGEPTKHDPYCPKVLTGIDIGKLPDTIIDRGVVIHMRRKLPTERVERLRLHKVETETEPLRNKLAEWAKQVTSLRDAEPELPEELSDRAADAWEPLLAIADLAGYGVRAREAAVRLAEESADDGKSLGRELLAAAQRAIIGVERVPSRELVEALNQDEEAPFASWEGGITQRRLAELLRPYGVKPRNLRSGTDVQKGYVAADFADAFARYPLQTPQSATEVAHEHYVSSSCSGVADDTGGNVDAPF
jgi:Protein of unknown function (DUF3631)